MSFTWLPMHSPIYPLIHLSIHFLIHPFDPFTLLFIFCLLFIFIHFPLFPLCLLYSSYSSLFIFTPPSTLFSLIHLVPPLLILSPPWPYSPLFTLRLFTCSVSSGEGWRDGRADRLMAPAPSPSSNTPSSWETEGDGEREWMGERRRKEEGRKMSECGM